MVSTLLFLTLALDRCQQPLRTAIADTCGDLLYGLAFFGVPLATMLLFLLHTDASEPWIMLLPVIGHTVRRDRTLCA